MTEKKYTSQKITDNVETDISQMIVEKLAFPKIDIDGILGDSIQKIHDALTPSISSLDTFQAILDKTINSATNSILKAITDENTRSVNRFLSVFAMRSELGRYGWVLPIFIDDLPDSAYEFQTPGMLGEDKQSEDNEVSRDFEDTWIVDEYIVEKYFSDDEIYFDRIAQDILYNTFDNAGKQRISQSIEAYKRELYAPCFFTLVPHVERFLSLNNEREDGSIKLLYKQLESQADMREIELCLEKLCLVKALKCFIKQFTNHIEFTGSDEPMSINRHWLLHGRSNLIVKQHHCLKIFCVIHALLTLDGQCLSQNKNGIDTYEE